MHADGWWQVTELSVRDVGWILGNPPLIDDDGPVATGPSLRPARSPDSAACLQAGAAAEGGRWETAPPDRWISPLAPARMPCASPTLLPRHFGSFCLRAHPLSNSRSQTNISLPIRDIDCVSLRSWCNGLSYGFRLRHVVLPVRVPLPGDDPPVRATASLISTKNSARTDASLSTTAFMASARRWRMRRCPACRRAVSVGKDDRECRWLLVAAPLHAASLVRFVEPSAIQRSQRLISNAARRPPAASTRTSTSSPSFSQWWNTGASAAWA